MKNKKYNWTRYAIVGGVGVIICFVSILISLLLNEQDNNIEGESVHLTNYYSDGDNEIDEMIEEVAEKAKLNNDFMNESEYSDNFVSTGAEALGIPISFDYNNQHYIFSNYYVEKIYIDKQISVDNSFVAGVYKIKYMTEKRALAVKSLEGDDYYIYVTEYYKPATLGDFLEETGFYEARSEVRIRMKPISSDKKAISYYDGFNEYLSKSFETLVQKEYLISDKEVGKYTGLSIVYYMDHTKNRVDMQFCENGDIFIKTSESMLAYYFETGEAGIEFAKELIRYLVENEEGNIM